MKEIKGKFNTAKIFASTIEESCEEQVLNLCDEKWTAGSKIRIMPDCHSGKGCVIGTTMTITDKVVPNLVGVDIGCGVLVTKFKKDILDLKKVDDLIKLNIPFGFSIHSNAVIDFTDELKKMKCYSYLSIDYNKVNKSIGSCGGGNHFIEIDIDDEGFMYLVIHTGSRNLGKVVAEYYQHKAKEYHSHNDNDSKNVLIKKLKAERRHSEIPQALKLFSSNKPSEHFEYLEGELFDDYLNDINIVQKFAATNRETISNIICKLLGVDIIDRFESVHNYIDTKYMILRKGSISAQPGERCLIPINMKDGTLICVGKGNADYNYSAPHGAGRLMSRKAAMKLISLNDYKNDMKDIYSSTVNENTIDEAPSVYKSIDEIMYNIVDTVDVIKHVKPIYNIKAD